MPIDAIGQYVTTKVRCKFLCTLKEDRNIQMSPVNKGSEENKKFFAATPGGQFSMYTVNEAALALFELGKEYYIDITKAE